MTHGMPPRPVDKRILIKRPHPAVAPLPDETISQYVRRVAIRLYGVDPEKEPGRLPSRSQMLLKQLLGGDDAQDAAQDERAPGEEG